MKYMLDTNICIYIIKKHPEKVLKKFTKIQVGEICLSSVTLAELEYGVEKSAHHQQNRKALSNFILPLSILPFDDEAAMEYGKVRTWLERKGTPIGPLDLMIASHALSVGSTVVTNNKKEFSRIPHLKIVDWTIS